MLLKSRSKKQSVDLDMTSMPKHVGIIMDGNGRWASKKNMPVSFGHSQGVNRIEDVVKVCINYQIESVSVYAFSTENWKRSSDEVNHLLKLIFKFYESKAKELYKNGVRLKFPGSKQNVPQDILDLFAKMEAESKENTNLLLNICFNYGARQEIVDSVNTFIANNDRKLICEQDIAQNLYDGINNDIDLLIRTSGEKRLSNFLLWQVSYSEFVFSDVLWPDFNQAEFKKCLYEYQMRNRRFGGR